MRDLSARHDTKAFAELVESVHPSDMAEALETLKSRDVARLLPCLKAGALAEVFVYFSEERQSRLLQELPRETVVALFEGMAADERVDLFHDLDEAARQRLLPALAHGEREDILRLAAYAEGSVGSVTTSDYVAVLPDMSVAQALAHVRATAADKETIYVIYVQDKEGHLCGTLSLRELLLADDSLTIRNIMRRDPVFARAQWPRSKASELIGRYDLLALPVINGGEKMVGIVTVDDAMDIEKQEDATQLARFGGTVTTDGTDLDILESPFRKMFSVRVFWLVLLTLFGVVTSTFVAAQEEILSQVIVLAAFIAPIVDMGGNAGSQSATLVIRAMALGDVSLRWQDVWRVVRRELPVAAALGLVVAAMETVLAWFSKGIDLDVLLVVGLSMLVCTVLGGIIGVLLPFVARRIGTDPATLSSPLITSIMDLVGVFIYFAFAYAFLAICCSRRAKKDPVTPNGGRPRLCPGEVPRRWRRCRKSPRIPPDTLADCPATALRQGPSLAPPARCTRPCMAVTRATKKAPSWRGLFYSSSSGGPGASRKN